MSSTQCVCYHVLQPNSKNCGFCKRVLPFAQEELLAVSDKLVKQIAMSEKLTIENEVLKQNYTDSAHKLLAAEKIINELRKENQEMKKKIADLTGVKEVLETENKKFTSELDDLTEQLFMEANNMVSNEARLRSQAEQNQKELKVKLEETKKQLENETEQLKELKSKIETYMDGDSPDKSYDGTKMFDPRLFYEFEEFVKIVKGKKGKPLSSLFIKRCITEDVEPCLKYVGILNYRRILEAVTEMRCFVESIPKTDPSIRSTQECTACDCKRLCLFRYRLGTDDHWKPIDRFCRDRIVAVCDFFLLIHHFKQGIFQVPNTDLYNEFSRARRQIFYARVGALQMFTATALMKAKKFSQGFISGEDPFGSQEFAKEYASYQDPDDNTNGVTTRT